MNSLKKKRGRPPGSKNGVRNGVVPENVAEKTKIIPRAINSVEKVKKDKIDNDQNNFVVLTDSSTPDEDGVITFGKNKNIGIVYDKYCVIVKQRKIKKDCGTPYWVDAPSPFQRDLESALVRVADIYRRERLKDSRDFDDLIDRYSKVHRDFVRDLKEFTSFFKGYRKTTQAQSE